MDISTLVRKPEAIHAILKTLPDSSVVTMKPCKIHFPVRFEEKDLASISNKISVLGYFVIILDDQYYGIVNIPTMIKLEPTYVNKIKIDDVAYYELTFEEGSTVISSTDLVMKDILTYYIYNEIIAGGNVPWYMHYSDLIRIFDESPKFAGTNVAANLPIMDMVAANTARNSKDLTKFYRHEYIKREQEISAPPTILALRNISHGASNTTAKLLGSYFSDGMTSALVNPSQRKEHIEQLLRR